MPGASNCTGPIFVFVGLFQAPVLGTSKSSRLSATVSFKREVPEVEANSTLAFSGGDCYYCAFIFLSVKMDYADS